MKMKVFEGIWYEAMDAFNKWAKGKQLNRDVIIQTHLSYDIHMELKPRLTIIVIHPEDPVWDSTQGEPIRPVLKTDAEISRLEREATGTAAEHEMVEQHIAGFQSSREE